MQHWADLKKFRGELKEIAIGATFALYHILPSTNTERDSLDDNGHLLPFGPIYIQRKVELLLNNDAFLHGFELDTQGVSVILPLG